MAKKRAKDVNEGVCIFCGGNLFYSDSDGDIDYPDDDWVTCDDSGCMQGAIDSHNYRNLAQSMKNFGSDELVQKLLEARKLNILEDGHYRPATAPDIRERINEILRWLEDSGTTIAEVI